MRKFLDVEPPKAVANVRSNTPDDERRKAKDSGREASQGQDCGWMGESEGHA